jgi:hypothetical protein
LWRGQLIATRALAATATALIEPASSSAHGRRWWSYAEPRRRSTSSADGDFRGGVILPGVGLKARCTSTPLRFPTPMVNMSKHPRRPSTRSRADVSTRKPERSSGSTPAFAAGADSLSISGGAARALSPRLTIPFELHDNLALDGLYRLSQDAATG